MKDDVLRWNEWNRKAKSKQVTATLKETYDLFMAGKSISEICISRGFKEETVQRQIIDLITKSLIDVNDAVPGKKFNLILEKIESKQFSSLTEIKESLPLEITWFEIKCVLAHLNSLPDKR